MFMSHVTLFTYYFHFPSLIDRASRSSVMLFEIMNLMKVYDILDGFSYWAVRIPT